MDPAALADLIRGSRMIFAARGGDKCPVDAEAPTIAFAFASVVAVRDIAAGETLDEDNLWVRRPGGGDFTAVDYESLLGRRLVRPLGKGARLTRTHLAA